MMSQAINRRQFLSYAGAGLAGLALKPSTLLAAGEAKPKNILLIGFDDLRCDLGCYGGKEVLSPNIDKFAAQGMMFSRAYVQQAVCSASRASFLTGCRPDTTTVDYPYNDYFRNEFLKTHPTLPTFFKNSGYHCRAFGKIHHGGVLDLGKLSEPYFNAGKRAPYALKANLDLMKKKKEGPGFTTPPTELADVPDNGYVDGRIADGAIETLRRWTKLEKPFCMSVGFMKPHLPWCAPKKYWDMYDRSKISLSPNPRKSRGAPSYAPATFELPIYDPPLGTKANPIDDDTARLLRHAYFACTSYVDAQFGKVMSELDRLGLRENTIVMLWSDHGWHLGDNGCWGKHTNYEWATRSPLIVSVPGMENVGAKCDALVEYVDMFPTLAELAGAETPKYLEGVSMTPLLADPKRKWKTAAFSQYPRGRTGELEGYAIRTDRYRYVEWRRKKKDGTFRVQARELYDHQADPLERTSVARANPEVVKLLAARLQAGWKSELPHAARGR
jgi:iduronate 2-sulfatase